MQFDTGRSPSLDDYRRLHLQISANPQMSEIPNEERVPYAYNKQKMQQIVYNGAPNDDEIFLNTPTQAQKQSREEVALAERKEQVSIQTSPEQNKVTLKQSGKTTQVSTPKPSLASLQKRK